MITTTGDQDEEIDLAFQKFDQKELLLTELFLQNLTEFRLQTSATTEEFDFCQI